MLARERVDRRLEHEVPGAAADACVEPDRGLLLHRAAARFGIGLVELAAQQGLEMRRLESLDQVGMRPDQRPDIGQCQKSIDHVIDGRSDIRRDQRPRRGQHGSNTVVDLVERPP